MKTRFVIPVALAVVAAAAIYFGVQIYFDQRTRAQIDKFIASLPPDVRVTYQDAGYGLASGETVISGA